MSVVLPKYPLPTVRKQERLPGEELSSFEDQIFHIVTQGDEHLAAFKFSRYNNFKRGLYPDALGETYDRPEALQAHRDSSGAIARLYGGKDPSDKLECAHMDKRASTRLSSVFAFASSLRSVERGELLKCVASFEEFRKTLAEPQLRGTAAEALHLGS